MSEPISNHLDEADVADAEAFGSSDNIAVALAAGHLESEFKNFVILGCNRVGGMVLVEAHVEDSAMLVHMKNQLAHVCRCLETDDPIQSKRKNR